MRGCKDRATLTSSEAYAQSLPGEASAAGAGPTGSDFLAAAGVTAPLASSASIAAATAAPAAPAQEAKQQQQMWGIMGFGGLFIDNYQLPNDPEQEEVDKKHDPLAKGHVAWGAPLQHDWQFSDPPKRLSQLGDSSSSSGAAWDPQSARSSAGLVAAATAVAAAAQPPPVSALSLAMRLVEGSQAAGITGGCCQGVRV